MGAKVSHVEIGEDFDIPISDRRKKSQEDSYKDTLDSLRLSIEETVDATADTVKMPAVCWFAVQVATEIVVKMGDQLSRKDRNGLLELISIASAALVTDD